MIPINPPFFLDYHNRVPLIFGSLRAPAPPPLAGPTPVSTRLSRPPTRQMVAHGALPMAMVRPPLASSALTSSTSEVSLSAKPSVSPPKSPPSSVLPLRMVSSVSVSTPSNPSVESRPSWTTPLLLVPSLSPLFQSSCPPSVSSTARAESTSLVASTRPNTPAP